MNVPLLRTAAVIAIPALIVGALWPSIGGLAVLVTLFVALALGSIWGRPERRGTPTTITRVPTRYEQRRWGFGIGLALGFHGVFPFIYIRRRFRS